VGEQEKIGSQRLSTLPFLFLYNVVGEYSQLYGSRILKFLEKTLSIHK